MYDITFHSITACMLVSMSIKNIVEKTMYHIDCIAASDYGVFCFMCVGVGRSYYINFCIDFQVEEARIFMNRNPCNSEVLTSCSDASNLLLL